MASDVSMPTLPIPLKPSLIDNADDTPRGLNSNAIPMDFDVYTIIVAMQESMKRESLVAAQRHEGVMNRLQEEHRDIVHRLHDQQRYLVGVGECSTLNSQTLHIPQVDNARWGNLEPVSPISGTSRQSSAALERQTSSTSSKPTHGSGILKGIRDASAHVRNNLARNSTLSLRSHSSHRGPHNAGCIRRILADERFELCIATVIFFNALALCAEVQYVGLDIGFDLQFRGCNEDAAAVWPAAELFLTLADWLFGSIFFIEAVVKIIVARRAYFRDAWNWLDLLCVLAFIFDKCVISILPVDGKSLRVLRLLRLIRLTRLVRSMEAFDSLFIMTTTIKGMKEMLFWAVTLLSVLLMTVALLLTPIMQATYFNHADASTMSPEKLAKRQEMYEYYGTFTRCMFTMFELTLANYPAPARLMTEEVSEWLMLFVLVHKLTMGFAVIGVLNGTILQETFKVASIDDTVMLRQKTRQSNLMKQKMLGLFKAMDTDKDGKLSFEEFKVIAEIPEVVLWLSSMGIETDDLAMLFVLVDADKSGYISVDEFINRLPRISGGAKGVDVMALDFKLRAAKLLPDSTGKNPDEQLEQLQSPPKQVEANPYLSERVIGG